jgi:nitrite reductase/ring-hydroxylating ferredoxin subunit
MNREEFNKSMCSAFILSALGLPLLSTSCSKSEEIGETGEVDEILLTDGIKREGNILTISMEHPKYQELKSSGNFINDLENGVLVLRKDAGSIIAVSNCCPHQGSRSRWQYLGEGKFLCTNHGNRFDIGAGNTAACNSNRTSGNLRQYPASFEEAIITIDLN